MSEKIDFNIDWDSLFPGFAFTVGVKTHTIKPLNVEGIANVSKKIKSIIPIIISEGITWKNLGTYESIIKIVPILIENAPEIISEATGISTESLLKFPPQYLIEITTIAVKANLESKESLEKNFESLVETLQSIQGVQMAGVENLV